jgi:deoxyribonuclease-4
MSPQDTFLIGAHMSVSGGLSRALERAAAYDFNCVQLFTHSPRVWALTRTTPAACRTFQTVRKAHAMRCVIVHAPYLPNCASVSPALWRRSCGVIARDVRLADALGADYYVMHPGSVRGHTRTDGIARVADALAALCEPQPPALTFLLENTGSGGSLLGGALDDLAEIMAAARQRCPSMKFGMCLDTAHAFGAGYDLRSDTHVARLWRDIRRTVGADALKMIHANDTNAHVGSGRDVHAHIGQGRIGRSGFARLMALPRLRRIPWILETPKDTPESDARNAATLRAIFAETRRRR